jgi:8-oxo-dGTP diphosphatase
VQVDVSLAIIFNECSQILITRRSANTSHAGKWEFPGGKVEIGETADQALIREIKEEVGLEVLSKTYIGKITHAYDDRCLNLWIYFVYKFNGIASCKEAQMGLRWVSLEELQSGQFEFLEANKKIIERIAQHLNLSMSPD